MKRNIYSMVGTVGLGLLIAILPACIGGSKTVANGSASFYLIDVLSKTNFNDNHIAGSINVPFDEIEKFGQSANKDAEIVVYCANYMCTASGQAALILKKMGFSKVWAYEGGSAEWFQMNDSKKFPMEGPCKDSYLRAPNNKPEQHDEQVPTISAQELYEKMVAHGMLSAHE